ncbi:Dynamitin-domain-containing protein [Tribonema minus]|uniref:Dynamitin-domain-containing protein n=1 Tax=Tribonema minus TaxID=303371 RepID=A0A835YPR0_9STRA|nr:Dynamitin-domain-containing protein [Tribonema minus]
MQLTHGSHADQHRLRLAGGGEQGFRQAAAPEHPFERLRRLQNECLELTRDVEQITQASQECNTEVGAGSLCDALATATGDIRKQLAHMERSFAHQGMRGQPLDPDLSELKAAQTRLAALEGIVGIVNGKIIEALEARCTLVIPGSLKSVSQQVQATSGDVQALLATNTSPDSSSSSICNQVLSAYAVTQKWDIVAATLPALIDRLQLLELVHAKSAQFTARLKHLEAEQASTVTLLQDLQLQLNASVKSMEDNVKIVQANVAALDQRMAAIAGDS